MLAGTPRIAADVVDRELFVAVVDLLEDRLAFGRLGITLQDGHALHGRNACLKQHGSLTAKRSDLFIRK